MCPVIEPDEVRGRGRGHPHLEPHQLDGDGDPHVAYLRVFPGEALGATLVRQFRRFDDAGYRAEIATRGLAMVARDEYRCLLAAGALDDRVSALEFALADVWGEVKGDIGVITVDEISLQFARLGWGPEHEQDPV